MAAEGAKTIGSLGVRIFANISSFNSNLGLAKGAVTQFVNHFNKQMKRLDSKALTNIAVISKNMQQNLQAAAAGGERKGVVTGKGTPEAAREKKELELRGQGYTDLGNKFAFATKQIRDGSWTTSVSVRKSMKDMSQGSIRSMLSLKAMFGKILHYITFSIGVQMVMMVRQGFQQMIDDIKKFERAATNAATVSGYLGGAFVKVRDHIMDVSKELGRKTVFSAMDVATAFYNLASAGYDVSHMMARDLEPILNYAAATQSTLEESTYAVATALKAFNLDMEDATRVVDTFTGAITNSFMTFEKMREAMKYVGPIAGALGIKLEETVSALMMLVDRGMEGSQAGQRLNMVFTKLLKPTEKTEAMLAGMGLTMDDLNPEVFTLTEILWKLKAAGFGAAEAATMFRARTAASATVLVNAASEIERYNQLLLTTSGITESVAAQQEQTLWGAFQLMTNAMQEAGLEVGETLIPALTDFAEVIRNSVAPYLANMMKSFVKLVPLLITLVKLFIVYKAAMFALAKILVVYHGIIKAAVIVQHLMNVVRLKGIAGIWAMIEAKIMHIAVTKGLTVATWGLAAALAVATAGVSIIVGVVAYLSLSMIDVATSSEVAGLAIENLAGVSLESLAQDFTGVELAIIEAANSAKTFSESVNEIKGLGMDIEFDEAIVNQMKGYDLVSKMAANQITGVEGMREAASNAIGPVAGFAVTLLSIPATIGNLPFDLLRMGIENLTGQTELNATAFKEMRARSSEVAAAMAGLSEEEYIALITETKREQLLGILSDELIRYKQLIDEVEISLKEERDALEDLNSYQNQSIIDIKVLTEKEETYRTALEKRRETESDLLGIITSILQETRRYSAVLDEGVGAIQDYVTATIKLSNKKEDLTRIIREEERAVLDVAEVLATEAATSDDVYNADAKLYSISRKRAAAQVERATLESEVNDALERQQRILAHGVTGEFTYMQLEGKGFAPSQIEEMTGIKQASDRWKEYSESLDVAVEATIPISKLEIDMLNVTKKMADAKAKYIDLLTQETTATAKLNALELIRDEYQKFTNEKMKMYLEAQMKIFDIEEKLYKLREGEKDQFDDLFQKMAEEGLVNKDTIDLYREMKVADGKLLGMKNKLMKVYGGMTNAQQDLASTLINTTDGTLEAADAEQALRDAGVSEGDIAFLISYNKAQDRLVDSVTAFGDEMGPLLDNLIEAGIVSPEVAKIWGDIADNGYEAAKATIELAIAQSKVGDTMSGLIDNTVKLARALQDESGEEIIDIFDELIDKMELTGGITGDVEDQLSVLNTFYGTAYDSLSEFTDEQLLTAAAMIQAAQASNMWIDGMTGVDLAKELNMGSLQQMINTTTTSIGEWEDTMYDLEMTLDGLKIGLGSLDGTLLTLSETLNRFLTIFERDMFGIWESSLQNMGDLLGEYGGNLWDVLKIMENEDVDFDMSVSSHWDGGDWDAFISGLKQKPKLFEKLLSKFGDMGYNISSSWDGEAWDKWYDGLDEDKMKQMDSIFNNFLFDFEIASTWDGVDYTSWYSNLSATQKGEMESAIRDLGGEFDSLSTWDNKDWNSFLVDLETKQAVALQDTLTNMGLYIPITYKVISGKGGPPVPPGFDPPKPITYSVAAVNMMYDAFKFPTPFGVKVSSTSGKSKDYWFGQLNLATGYGKYFAPGKVLSWGKGGIVAAKDGYLTNGPQMAMIGEAGAEAVIPLEGANKKYGRQILSKILPKYFPDIIGMQTGGIVAPGIGGLPGFIGGEENLGGDIKDRLVGIYETILKLVTFLYKGISIIDMPITAPMPIVTPPIPGVPIPVSPGGGESEGTAGEGSIGADITVRQGGKKINISIIIDANQFNSAINEFATAINTEFEGLVDEIRSTIIGLDTFTSSRLPSASSSFVKVVESAARYLRDEIDKVTPIKVIHTHTFSITTKYIKAAEGGIFGAARGGIAQKPTFGMFGEAGAEALIPLEGKNKKFGRKILETIIPEFYPNLAHQTGGLYNYNAPNIGGGDTDVYQDNFNIYGPIELPGVSNGEAFAVELKRQFRAAPGGG